MEPDSEADSYTEEDLAMEAELKKEEEEKQKHQRN